MSLVKRIRRHGLLIGLLSLAWLLIRSGTKPSRINYPCQQVAKANVLTSATILVAPIAAVIQSGKKGVDKRLIASILILIAVSAVAYSAFQQQTQPEPNPGVSDGEAFPIFSNNTASNNTTSNGTTSNNPASNSTNSNNQTSNSTALPSSRIYVVNNYTGTNDGLSVLLKLMEENGIPFYKTSSGENTSPEGLIAADDVIIIKVNSQWNQRGGTNTDLLKELITLLIAHPDGFHGEIVVADNGQTQYGSLGQGGSFNWDLNNAEDKSQSIQNVVDSFTGSRVSTYRWDDITTTRVAEYSDGDFTDGYIVEEGVDQETGLMVSYPKFTTKYGTQISFKYGVWEPDKSSYDSEHLKVINLPVLKTHGGYGVTGAIKNYMGVPSDKLTASLGHRTHSVIDEGAMGTLMAETRFPTITILDCIWVNAIPLGGPGTSYSKATRVNVVAASVDPIALDYWASKNILMKAAPTGSDTSSMDPDNSTPGSFGDWLQKSAKELEAAGLPSELNPENVGIYVKSVS